MGYVVRSYSEKKNYAQKFTPEQLKSYRQGERIGFLKGVHKNKQQTAKSYKKIEHNYTSNKYSEKELNSLFANLDEYK